MNVERLHLIARELHNDLERAALVQHLSSLAEALQNLASQPGESTYQQQVTTAREAVQAAVASSGVDDWPAAWRATLEDLGVDDLVGSNLALRVEGAIVSNEITPATASTAVQELSADLASVDKSLTEMLAVFDRFSIAAEELEIGEAEVAVTIPRGEVSERLVDLGREFEELNKILGVFVEIETGGREPMRVRTIASSDYGVYLETAVHVGAFIAVSIERLLAGYKTLLEIRTLRQGLADQGLEDQLGPIDERVNTLMDEKIREYVDEVVAERFADDDRSGRGYELEIELLRSLRMMANRIDHGFNFDVRAPEPDPETDESDVDADVQAATQRIVAASPNLKYINRTGQAILSLPEGRDPTGSSEDESA
ncbi:hypothetical protein [Nocardioides dilutus]